MFVLDQKPSLKRRRRESLGSISLSEDDDVDSPSAKRAKRASEAVAYGGHRPPSFWNRLSKVHLTRGALNEFDRRILGPQRRGWTPPTGIDASRPRIKNLKQFTRLGGPDLAHIRGLASQAVQDGTMSRSSLSRKRSAASGSGSDPNRKSRSSYDANFEQNLIDGGIYPVGHEPDGSEAQAKPRNMDDVRRVMRVPRPALSPSQFSDAAFDQFNRQIARAADEATVRADILSLVAGNGRKSHRSASDRLFNHLDPVSDDLPPAEPDSYDGAPPRQIDRRVRHDLGKHIVPCNRTSLPAAPNFFVEAKSDDGRAAVLKVQACHDGAIGARAMHSLQNYGSTECRYDGNAYSYSSIYHNGTLRMYSHHPAPPKTHGRKPQYYMAQIRGFDITDNIDSFREGAAAFRNLRDLAKAHRDDLIHRANQLARQAPARSASTTVSDRRTSLSVSWEDQSDTSAAELALDQSMAKRSRYASAEISRSAPVAPTAVPYSGPHDARTSTHDMQHETRFQNSTRR